MRKQRSTCPGEIYSVRFDVPLLNCKGFFTCLFSTRFIKAASLQGLSQQDTTAAPLCTAISEDTHTDLIIDCSTSPPTLLNAGNLGLIYGERDFRTNAQHPRVTDAPSLQSAIVSVMTGFRPF